MFATGAEVDAALGNGVRPDGLDVLLVRLDPGGGDDIERWVVDDVGDLIGHLRRMLGEAAATDHATQMVAVVLTPIVASARQAAAIEATWQAVRGVVQSLTRELDARAVRLNAVRATAAAPDALRDTLAFLASKRAGFVAGSSFDLKPTTAGPSPAR